MVVKKKFLGDGLFHLRCRLTIQPARHDGCQPEAFNAHYAALITRPHAAAARTPYAAGMGEVEVGTHVSEIGHFVEGCAYVLGLLW